MKQTLLILALFLQSFLAFAENITEKSSVADSLLIELRALPHDTTRLKLLEKLVLTEQNSPHYIEYAEEMFNEAQRQKNPKYICSSTYFKILYYYNKNEVDSVSKLVNYVKPIAERMEFFRLYFNAQKLLIYTYTYKEKYEYAINESLKMLEKAEELNNTDGRIAAYSCLASAYHETNRTKEEGEALRKAYKYVSEQTTSSTQFNVLNQLIVFSKDQKDYSSLKTYLKENKQLLQEMLSLDPDMYESYFNLYLFSEIFQTYYYTGIGKIDSAKYHIEEAQDFITPQSYIPYMALYYDASAEYYRHTKDYQAALLYIDSALIKMKQFESAQMEYAKQLSRKADILQEMGKYAEALPLYESSNHIQDSLTAAISAKQLEEIKEIHHLNQLVWERGKLRNRVQTSILLSLGIILILCIGYMFRINLIRKALKISEKETHKATRQTEEANEMKNRFLSNMSHAIRVPLNGVLGFSQIIAHETEIDDQTRKEYAEIIQQNTDQLMRLVNNVLDLSRLEAGMMKFQMSNYDIVQLCNDAVGMAHMQNPTLHTHFISNIDEYIIHTDTNRFMQFIVSILTCPFASFKEERDLNFTLNKNGEILRFKITNCPLADLKYANQDSALRNDVNRLFIKHFGGTYQVIPDSKEGPTILFTYPATSVE